MAPETLVPTGFWGPQDSTMVEKNESLYGLSQGLGFLLIVVWFLTKFLRPYYYFDFLSTYLFLKASHKI